MRESARRFYPESHYTTFVVLFSVMPWVYINFNNPTIRYN